MYTTNSYPVFLNKYLKVICTIPFLVDQVTYDCQCGYSYSSSSIYFVCYKDIHWNSRQILNQYKSQQKCSIVSTNLCILLKEPQVKLNSSGCYLNRLDCVFIILDSLHSAVTWTCTHWSHLWNIWCIPTSYS